MVMHKYSVMGTYDDVGIVIATAKFTTSMTVYVVVVWARSHKRVYHSEDMLVALEHATPNDHLPKCDIIY
jgi:hypothetical protein